jgi:hypothetical protein
MGERTVDSYIEGLEGWQRETAAKVREIVNHAAPTATEAVKWSQPVFESNGPFAYIKEHSKTVNFGFWRGVDIDDPQGVLEGSGEKMRHVKLSGLDDIDEALFADFVKQAVMLNESKGDPTKNK